MTVCRSRWILVTLAALPAALTAQAPRRVTPAPATAPAASALGSVRGVIFDSLLSGPLEGARVWINGTNASAMTDAGGRFRLDSVPPGQRLIAFEHADLDSIGLSNNARRIQVASGRPTVVELAVPSLLTMRRAACASRPGSAREEPADSGIVFGTVIETERGTRLAGARVFVAWTTAGRGPDGRVLVGRPVLDVTTDSLGNYYACGVPTEFVVTAVAQAGRSVSGLTELLLGPRSVARRDISVSRDTAALVIDTASNTRSGHATIVGVVTDENGQPRPSARASVDDAQGEAFTDERGRFVLPGLPAGSQMLMARMIGYSAVRVPVVLRNGDTTRVTLRMRALSVLDTLRVTATTRGSRNAMNDLEDRMRSGLGYFLRGEDVKRRPSMRSVFSGLPSLQIEGRSVFNFRMHTLASGRICPVSLFVDGLPTTTEAIQSYRPDQLVAVEWYPRGSQAPLRYQGSGTGQCGIMLMWTRFM